MTLPPFWSFSGNRPIRYSNPSLSAWGTNFGGMTTKRRVMICIKGFLAFSWAKSCSPLQTYSAPGIRSVLTVGRLVGWLVGSPPPMVVRVMPRAPRSRLPPSPSLALHQVTPETWGPLLCLSSSTNQPPPSHLSHIATNPRRCLYRERCFPKICVCSINKQQNERKTTNL